MLILSARKGESIFLFGKTIKVQVVNVVGNCVRLGFDMPPEVDAVTEKKLLEEFRKQQEASKE